MHRRRRSKAPTQHLGGCFGIGCACETRIQMFWLTSVGSVARMSARRRAPSYGVAIQMRDEQSTLQEDATCRPYTIAYMLKVEGR